MRKARSTLRISRSASFRDQKPPNAFAIRVVPFAAPPQGRRPTRRAQERINVVELLTDVRKTLDDQLDNALRVSVSDETLTVAANRDALKGALFNLVTNADQAGGTNILLHAHRFGDSIHLCVSDDGPGVPDGALPRLFEPFFTTRPQGTGLGLSVVKAVAEAHGGDVAVNTSDLGTSFTIMFPADTEEA